MADHSFSLGRQVAPVRFVLFAAIFAIGAMVLGQQLPLPLAMMGAFDIAATIFLLSVLPLFRSHPSDMRRRARANDANRALLLGISVAVTLVVLFAVSSEMMARDDKLAIAQVVLTLALAWLFSNTVYTLHYAHLYYLGDDQGADRGGISFPGKGDADYWPDYWDFAYFSFTLGMTFQTSDVEITAPGIRRIVLGQCIAAFVFNIGVLALSINILGGG